MAPLISLENNMLSDFLCILRAWKSNNSFVYNYRIESTNLIQTILRVGITIALCLVPLYLSDAHAGFSYETHTKSNYNFTIPPGLSEQVDFWKKIYSEYTTQHAVIHDMGDLGITYEIIYLGEKPLSRRAKERRLDKVKSKYRTILRRIA